MRSILSFIVIRLPFIHQCLLLSFRIIVQYIIRYRSKVIQNNLINSFGQDKSPSEISRIKRYYYKVLTRYIKEIIFKTVWSPCKIQSVVDIIEVDEWNKFINQQNGVIVMASHSGNWEFNLPILPLFLDCDVVAFYKPISNQWMDKLMLKLRSQFGMKNFPIEQTARVMAQYRGKNAVFIFVGDQSPINMNGVYWNTFLHQDTPWLTGAEKLATRNNMPVLYLEQIPYDSLGYNLKFHVITLNPSNLEKGAITQKYSEILEHEIHQRPEFWLWSHRRWKRSHLKPQ